MDLVFGIGGTNTRIGISEDGETISKSIKIPTEKNFKDALESIEVNAYKLLGDEWPKNVVAGVAGVLNKQRTGLFHSPYLPDWNGKDLQASLKEIFKAPVFLENDAELEALGEATHGAGKGKKIVAFLVVGTGMGGARVVDGRIDATVYGQEPGHQLLSADQTNNLEELEHLVSGTAIAKNFGQKAEHVENPLLWQRVARRFAVGLHNTIVHWSPDIVVLGGSVGRNLPIDIIKQVLKKTLSIYPEIPEITLSKLGDSAGLVGALEYLKAL